MGESFLDDLARRLAEPMPRRRALRLIGGAIAAATVPALRPSRALAGGLFGTCGSPCPAGTSPCQQTHLAGCFKDCCHPGDTCCKFSGPAGPNGVKCCPPDSRCGRQGESTCVFGRRCRSDEHPCGPQCCKPNEECTTFRAGLSTQHLCVPRCNPGETRCGPRVCCPHGQRCLDPTRGICGRCRPTEVPCGRGKCCDRRGVCCDARTGLCCKPGERCGSYGSGRTTKHICCKHHSCQASPGSQPFCCQNPDELCLGQLPSGPGALTPSSQRVCCPPDRQVSASSGGAPIACCPPGQVPLGDRLVVGAGIQGLCCSEAQTCGTGADLTCCPTGQSCCDGACSDLLVDAANCGSCGHQCAGGTVCRQGQCVRL